MLAPAVHIKEDDFELSGVFVVASHKVNHLNFFQDARLHDTVSRKDLEATSILITFKLRHEEARCREPRNQDVQALLPVVLGACCPQAKLLRKSLAANATRLWPNVI